MKILYATSEMAPFAKTGGLGDVAGALPKALADLGHEVAVVMPLYGKIDRAAIGATLVMPEILVDLPAGRRKLAVWRTELANGTRPVTVYLVEDDALFGRPQLYDENGKEYPDNPLRFAYFCMAALWMLHGVGFIPDLIHCNDWQTALIPAYRRYNRWLRDDPALAPMRTILTIHNLSFQGIHARAVLDQIGLPASAFNPDEFEFFGYANLLKGGLSSADWMTTVSRQYAREIQTPEFGCGLEGFLQLHSGRLTGILNGIDNEAWDPQTDPRLRANFGPGDMKGKALCKHFLQKRFGLPVEASRPLMAVVSRLTDQKGLDLLTAALPELLKGPEQFVLLGTGQPKYEEFLKTLAVRYPRRVGIEIGFDDELAHQIEAGADIFMMPSRFEPCGLNQLYSLRYATVPVVRRVGGLADSIVNATPTSLANGKATGFVFTPYLASSLGNATRRALSLYRREPKRWRQLAANGMAQDFSWEKSAKQYERLMKKLLKQV